MTAATDRRVAARGLVAAALATTLNVGLVTVAQALAVAPGFEPLSYPPTVLLTIMTSVAATFVYAAVRRLSSRPGRTFTRLAAVVLVASFVPDVILLQADPAATVPGVLVLALLHVVAAVVDVRVLTRGLGDLV